MAMLSAPRALEVKLVRFAETAAEEKINALLAEDLVMLQCIGMADTMVLLRYATPMYEGKQEIRLVRLGDVDAETVINLALGCDFVPMGHVGSRSQYLLMSRFVAAAPRTRPRAVPHEDASISEPASMEGMPPTGDDHDADACPACNPRERRDN